MFRRLTVFRVGIFVVNLAIVIYMLYLRLVKRDAPDKSFGLSLAGTCGQNSAYYLVEFGCDSHICTGVGHAQYRQSRFNSHDVYVVGRCGR